VLQICAVRKVTRSGPIFDAATVQRKQWGWERGEGDENSRRRASRKRLYGSTLSSGESSRLSSSSSSSSDSDVRSFCA
jgi:hypothetical protein